MPTAKLTKRKVDEIRRDGCGAPGPRTFWYDTDLKGFGLKIEPSGATTWILEYRPGVGGRGTQKKRLTLGPLGKLTPDEAREMARAALVRVHAGDDPAALKTAAKSAMSMAELCEAYLDDAGRGNIIGRRGTPKKQSTLSVDRGRVSRHIVPLLGKKPVAAVTKADIERFLRDVAAGKTATDVKTGKRGRAIVRGGRGTATRTVRLLGGIFSYAVGLGLRADNPTQGVVKFADREGARFLSSEELQRLGQALRDGETVGLPWRTNPDAPGAKYLPKDAADRRTTLSPHAAGAIRLLIFTGARLGEILNLEWRHVDMERGLLFLPDSKTGAKTVVLGAPALQILASMPRVEGSPYVIVSDNPKKPRRDLKRPWQMVTRAAGLEGVRLHDLRHTFASHGAAAGMGLTVVGRLLGHADVKTTNRYSHFDADPLRRVATAVGSTLAAAMGDDPGADDKIVPISKKSGRFEH